MSEKPDTSPTATGWKAERLLLGLLELIKQSESIQDLSAARISQHMQQPVTEFAPGDFGYSGSLTPDWKFVFELQYANTDRARLDLEFIDKTTGRSVTATDICQVDFERFSSELQQAGFTRSTNYGEHGTIIDDLFVRPGLSVKVATIGEAADPLEKAQHACIVAVTVQ